MGVREMSETRNIKMKVCLIGDFAVGKTSLIQKYVYDTFSDRYIQTVGAKITKKSLLLQYPELRTDLDIDLTIWDIMGEKGFRELLKEAYFYGAQGLLAVCDLTREDTFYELPTWINAVDRVVGRIPTVFLGNKIDLTDSTCVKEDDMKMMGESYDSNYILTSAKTGENVEGAFLELAEIIAAKDVLAETPSFSNAIILE
ncbi:MAG: Rab family GTPase [Thermoplasmata archaeon]